MDVIYSAACLKAIVHIKNYRIRALLNGGSKINIINKIIIESLDLAVSPCREISLIDTNTKEVSIEGIIKNILIFIGAVMMVQIFLVMNRMSKPLILDILFMAAIRFQTKHSVKKAIKVTFTNPRNSC